MGKIDTSNAERPKRRRFTGANTIRADHFFDRYPPAAKRHSWIGREILFKNRKTPVNPNRTEIDDPAAVSEELKALTRTLGADIVGIAKYDPRFTFDDGETLNHKYVIVFAMNMAYDCLVEIGPRSQGEVHRVYYALDDVGVRLANQIGAYGYNAWMQPNGGELPLIPYAQLAGLGELGKHGSLISPELGSSFRLSAVSTDMPLLADGPTDHGIEEFCTNCNICVRFCPGDAIKHEKSTVAGVMRWYVDTPACEPYFYGLYGCKICLMVCPFNARGIGKENYKPVAADIRTAKDAPGMLKIIQSRSEVKLAVFDEEGNMTPETEGA